MKNQTTKISILALAVLVLSLSSFVAYRHVQYAHHRAVVLRAANVYSATVSQATDQAIERVRHKEQELDRLGITGTERQRQLDLEKNMAVAELKRVELKQFDNKATSN